MRFLLSILFLTISVRAGDLPWLGVGWQKASKEEHAKVGLPGHVGFQVGKVVPDGPWFQAMGRKGDLWWKFDNQILVSKCQLLVLLRARKPGDEIPVEFFRAGKLQKLQLTLGTRPEDKMYSIGNPRDRDIASRTLLTRREKVARLSADGHDFALEQDDETLKFEVRKGEDILLDVSFHEKQEQKLIPPEWLESYLLLKLALDRPVPPATEPQRRRVRYVPRNQGSEE